MRAIALGMVLVAALVACDGTTTPEQGIAGGGAGGGTTTTVAVTIGDNFFSPVQDTVGVGGTVTWTWTGTNRHQITFDDGARGSDTLTTGTFSRTFNTTGTFTYFDGVFGRQVMNGAIIVQ